MEMQMEYIRKLPEPQELMEQFPIDDKVKAIKAKRDEEIKDILTGKDNRFLLIIGPCSADNEPAVLDYIHRLVKVQEQVKDKIFIIPRSIPANRYYRRRLQRHAPPARPGRQGRHAGRHHRHP